MNRNSSMIRSRTSHLSARFALLVAGAVMAAAGLQLFLAPHALLTGGAAGASLLIAQIAGWPLAAIVALFYLSVWLGGYRRMSAEGRKLALPGLAVLTIGVYALDSAPALIDAPLPASVAGGMLLGLGFGLLVRCGGFGDAADEAPPLLVPARRRAIFQKAVWIGNAGMLASIWSLHGREAAMYSALAFAATRAFSAWSFENFSVSFVAVVDSDRIEEIEAGLSAVFGRAGTRDEPPFGSGRRFRLLFSGHRSEWILLKRTVREIDSQARMYRLRK